MAQSHESTTSTESHDADALADSWPQSESSKDISVTLDVDQSQLQHDDDHVTTTTSFEEMLERNLEGFGRVMFFQVILIGLAGFFDSQQAFISIYADAIPTWHCTNNGSTTCDSKHSDICELHASEWAWDEIPSKTIISEWGLQCSTALLRGLPASSHFAGTILGVFVLASLADSWLGRKKMLLYSCLTMSVTGIMTILSINVWIYSSLRFVTGFCRATIGSSVIILLSEVVGKKWRGRVGNLLFFFFMVGGMFSVMIAFVGQKLKMMQITLSLASFLCADTAFNLILVYSVEMFPTCVRNFAASMARQAITFGAVLGALLNSFGRKNPYLSYDYTNPIVHSSHQLSTSLFFSAARVLADPLSRVFRK
ncbi:hypothetical protein LWI28_021122 [Acer negundo]|uniref:Major facilitator superfamily (MFS) profile domain-containing protein n=1 Tax=Acer negundo TaxID=4023 RepID=A0AAD5NH76_ACENE|nr:hypothetical protein LWI28_021122 [Acer negundo]